MKLFLQNLLVLGLLFAPGYLAGRVVGLKLRLIPEVIAALIISLAINYLVMMIAAAVGVKSTGLIRGAYALLSLSGAAALIWRLQGLLTRAPNSAKPTGIHLLGWCAVLLLLGASFLVVFSKFELIFRAWDAVASWNRWSIQWSTLTYPDRNLGYPQLIPANIGLIYIAAGSTDHQFYGRLLHAVLALIPVLIFVDLFRISKRLRHLVGGAAFVFAASNFSRSLLDGYMDLPAASISFAFCYFWFLTRYVRPKGNAGVIWTAVLLSVAGLVKQSGIMASVYFGALFAGATSSSRRAVLFVSALIAMLATWYLPSHLRDLLGYDTSNVTYVTGFVGNLHKGRDHFERVVFAISSLCNRFGPIAVIVASASIVFASWRDPKFRKIVPFLALYFTAWSLFWSYSLRHAVLLVPFASWAVGIAGERAWATINTSRFVRSFRGNAAAFLSSPGAAPTLLIAAVVIVVVAFSLTTSNRKLIARQVDLMTRRIGDLEANRQIRHAAAAGELTPLIVTNYFFLSALPDFRGYQVKRADHLGVEGLRKAGAQPGRFTIIELRKRFPIAPAWISEQMAAGNIRLVRQSEKLRLLEYRNIER